MRGFDCIPRVRHFARGLIAVLALATLAPAAQAAVYTVNSNSDPASGTASNCTAGNAGTCTLRDAITAATNGDTINFTGT